MKETKVYVGELPPCCSYCPCSDIDNEECNITGYSVAYIGCHDTKPDNCPLVDIKTHDRALIKEVCEKIKNNVNDMPYYDDRTGYVSPTDVCEMIDELQKEFENE